MTYYAKRELKLRGALYEKGEISGHVEDRY